MAPVLLLSRRGVVEEYNEGDAGGKGDPSGGVVSQHSIVSAASKVDDQSLIDAPPEQAKRQLMQMVAGCDKLNIEISTVDSAERRSEPSTTTSMTPSTSATLPILAPDVKKMKLALPPGSGAPKLVD